MLGLARTTHPHITLQARIHPAARKPLAHVAPVIRVKVGAVEEVRRKASDTIARTAKTRLLSWHVAPPS